MEAAGAPSAARNVPRRSRRSSSLRQLPARGRRSSRGGERSSFPARQPADLPEHSRRTSLRDLRSSPACGRWSSPLGRRTSPSPAEPLLAAAEARSPPGVARGRWSSLVGRRTSPSPAKLLLAAAEAWSPPGVVRGRWSSPTTGRRTTSARPADLPWWRTELHTCAAGGACRRAAAGLAGVGGARRQRGLAGLARGCSDLQLCTGTGPRARGRAPPRPARAHGGPAAAGASSRPTRRRARAAGRREGGRAWANA